MTPERLDRFWELVGEMLVIYDAGGLVRRANAAWSGALGLDEALLIGRPLLDLVEPADRARAAALLDVAGAGLGRGPLELRMRAADGTSRVFAWSVTGDPSAGLFYGTARDVTQAMAAADALRTSEERYRELFESHPIAMAVWDPATRRILALNDAAVRQYGYSRSEALELTVDQIVHPDDLPRLADALGSFSSGVDGGAPFRHVRRDGTVIEVEMSGHSLAYGGRPARLVMAIDVTERRSLEARLREAQKMEAVGRLAGGIAHGFNNLLTAILGYGRLLVEELAEDDPRRADAVQIQTAGERAAELTAQLLALSRADLVEPSTFDLNTAVRELVPALTVLAGADVALELDLAAAAPWVRGDRGRVTQLLVDLTTNARDAMPAGGRLVLATADLGADAARARGMDGGPAVALTVTDTGTGIAGDVRELLFEPFFSTKSPGRATGLGLATAYATVRQAGGQIHVESTPGQGTSLRIVLPLAAPPRERPAGPPPRPGTRPGATSVLLAEDEPAVRELVARQLRSAGYDVVAAPDGAMALELAQRTRVDLVVTDIVMPGLSGRQLARELRARSPDLPILLMSGYSGERADDPATGRLEVLVKPFDRDELLRRVARLLEGDSPTGGADDGDEDGDEDGRCA